MFYQQEKNNHNHQVQHKAAPIVLKTQNQHSTMMPKFPAFPQYCIMWQARRAEVHTQLAGRCPDPLDHPRCGRLRGTPLFWFVSQMNTVVFYDGKISPNTVTFCDGITSRKSRSITVQQ